MCGAGGSKQARGYCSLHHGGRLDAFVRVLTGRNDPSSLPGLSGDGCREWQLGCVFGLPVCRLQAALRGARAHGCVGRAWRAKELGEKVGECLFGGWVDFPD